MITKEKLQEIHDRKMNEFSRNLIQFRIDAELPNPHMVARELKLGRETVYLAEKGDRLTTRSILDRLLDLYAVSKSSEIYMFELRNEIAELRKSIRELE